MKVIKRDGREVEFNKSKIFMAIIKAMKSTNGKKGINIDIAKQITNCIFTNAKDGLTVEEIQDQVEEKLMDVSKDVARSFIIYRNERTKARNLSNSLTQSVLKRVNATSVENSNANVDEHSFSGREKEASSDIQKIIALDYTLSSEVSNAHKNMLVYQHDLEKTNIGQHNCLNVDFNKAFSEGFHTRNGDVRPPSNFATACQLIAVIFQCQSQVC